LISPAFAELKQRTRKQAPHFGALCFQETSSTMSVLLAALLALLALPLVARADGALGDLANISCAAALCSLSAFASGSSGATVPLRLQFFAPQVVRYWLALDGNFSDNGFADDVLVGAPQPVTLALRDAGAYYEVTQSQSPPLPAALSVVAQLLKSPLQLTLLVGGHAVAQESAPLAWNGSSTWQTLARDAAPFAAGLSAEYFFGGGMQNGHWSHRDTSIEIAVDYNWALDGHPNSVPFYVSTAGYGVMRNTWQPGGYSFTSPVVTIHNESNRFDAFFVLAAPGDIKSLLSLYTYLTGPPYLPPIYAMFLGDSDCYHNDRHGNSTQVAIGVANLYEQYDMPRGWMLVNDGYGCGYGEGDAVFPNNLTDLTFVVAELHKVGIYTGLWTSTGMPHIADEVGVAGTRIAKTDVGWIGDGYKYAFDGVSTCANGIEQYSTPPARRSVWTVEGWAGTHRLATMWTGDDSGSMDYVQWQIPTFIGTGFSAQAHVSGDIDGIFGGSPESYVRDLQFKALMTTIMTMSGWAANPDKQPWTWGEPFTTYNRAALKLKSRLTPYMYSASREAYDTGVPPVRAMLLEFPEDEVLYTPSNGSSYQFLSGASLLVAPVYELGAVTRDGIYLPKGSQWSDYADGTLYEGGQTIDGYAAPLDKLPIFVRAGAIIPLWPEMNFFNATPHDPISLELWPSGNSTFTLYEDDGITRAALPPTNAFATTLISVSAPSTYLNTSTSGNVTIAVAPASGSFDGQLASRGWFIEVRARSSPLNVVVVAGADGAPVQLPAAQSAAELAYLPAGFFFNPELQRGLLQVKLSGMAAADGFVVTLSNGPSYAHIGTETCDTPLHRQVEEQRFALNAEQGTFAVGNSSSSCLTIGLDKDPDSHTPALEVQDCSSDLADRQSFVVLASGQIAFKSDPTTCLDQDVSDDRVIAYGCHDPSSPGNQGWVLDAKTQHVISAANGLCMAVFPAA